MCRLTDIIQNRSSSGTNSRETTKSPCRGRPRQLFGEFVEHGVVRVAAPARDQRQHPFHVSESDELLSRGP